AVEFYKLVLQQSPGDAEASKGLGAAQTALTLDQDQRKKQDDFQKHLAAGQAALKAGRYADAVAELAAAQVVLPKNAVAAALQRDAERLLAADKNRKDQRTDYEQAVDRAATALRNQRFDDAIASYKKALQLQPNDATATKGLADATAALRNAAL